MDYIVLIHCIQAAGKKKGKELSLIITLKQDKREECTQTVITEQSVPC